jgi:chromosome partitioning protein
MLHVCLTNTKGGVSKSTLASQLAIWVHDQGYRVGLLDVDPQGTSSNWIQLAEPTIPVRTAESLDEIEQAREELGSLVDVLVLDTPGNSRSDMAQAATLLSDIAIIPLQPSKADLREIKNALTYVKLGQAISGGAKPLATIVITMTAKGDLQTRQLRRDLAAFELPVAAAEIRRLNVLRDGFGTGVTRSTARDARMAAEDLESLFVEILSTPLRQVPRSIQAKVVHE